MESNNYYYLEQLENDDKDEAMIEHMVGGDGGDGDESDQEKETFLVGYEANGGLIEGMENDDDEEAMEGFEDFEGFEGDRLIEGMNGGNKKVKKLRRKLKRARRRARRAENRAASANTAGYWDGWWDSNSYDYDDDYYYPPAYPQPMYIPPPVVQSGEPDIVPLVQGVGDSKWAVFAGLIFVIFVALMVMIAKK